VKPGLSIWVFLKPDFEILAFFNTLGFFEIKKRQTKSGFFGRKG